MTRILIADDEALARARIRRFLEGRRDVEIEVARDGVEALEKIRAFKPDLVLLDIEMPGFDGFQVLRNLEERPFKVIFQTAYDAFALRAFEENACDYLLKPFTQQRFDAALARALERIDTERRLLGVEARLTTERSFLEQFVIRQGTRLQIVSVEDVLYLTSQDHYTLLHGRDGAEWVCDLSLTHIAARLDPARFRRVHRRAIVRRDQVAALHGGEKMEVELKGGGRLPVSRAQRGDLARWLECGEVKNLAQLAGSAGAKARALSLNPH